MAHTQKINKNNKVFPNLGQNCPFMDTIHRKALDFDFEKICSVTLSKQNVYACLVCGIFYGGRSKSTPAFFHSIDANHHLFLNLASAAVYCLPEGYQVDDASLDDIKHALDPKYSAEEIKTVVYEETYSVSLKGVTFIPGRVGINNLGRTDGFNAVLQCLYAVPGLVEFFLDKKKYEQVEPLLAVLS